MAAGETSLAEITRVLARRYRVADLNPGSGRLRLSDSTRTVWLDVPPALLDEYLAQLTDDTVSGLSGASAEEQDRLLVKHVVMRVEEIFESDLDLSLQEIRLARRADGRPSLGGHRGVARRPVPAPTVEGGHWSSDRSG